VRRETTAAPRWTWNRLRPRRARRSCRRPPLSADRRARCGARRDPYRRRRARPCRRAPSCRCRLSQNDDDAGPQSDKADQFAESGLCRPAQARSGRTGREGIPSAVQRRLRTERSRCRRRVGFDVQLLGKPHNTSVARVS
jgi:hypothetical protein